MADRAQAQKEFDKYFKGRAMTDTDFTNYQKDPGAFAKSYKSITTGKSITPQAAGQEANSMLNLGVDPSNQGQLAAAVIQAGLEAKARSTQQIEEKKLGVKNRISKRKLTDKEFAGLRPSDKLQAYAKENQLDLNQLDYLNDLTQNTLNTQEGILKQANIAISDIEAAKNVRRGGGSGGGGGKAKKSEEDAFLEDAMATAQDLHSGKIDWGQAWNYLKARWGVDDDILDNLLGGSVTKDAYGNDVYEGWATPGYYENQQANR